MEWSSEYVFAAAIAVVAFLAGILWLRTRGQRTRVRGQQVRGAPPQARFICASCAGRFTHNRRTAIAWQHGAKSFYCNACHTRSLGEGAPPKSSYVPKGRGRPGCLGVVLILGAVPVAALVVLVAHRMA